MPDRLECCYEHKFFMLSNCIELLLCKQIGKGTRTVNEISSSDVILGCGTGSL